MNKNGYFYDNFYIVRTNGEIINGIFVFISEDKYDEVYDAVIKKNKAAIEKQLKKYGKDWEDNYKLYKAKNNPIKDEFDFKYTAAAKESSKLDKKAKNAIAKEATKRLKATVKKDLESDLDNLTDFDESVFSATKKISKKKNNNSTIYNDKTFENNFNAQENLNGDFDERTDEDEFLMIIMKIMKINFFLMLQLRVSPNIVMTTALFLDMSFLIKTATLLLNQIGQLIANAPKLILSLG